MESDLVAALQRSESHPHTIHYQTLSPKLSLLSSIKNCDCSDPSNHIGYNYFARTHGKGGEKGDLCVLG